MKPILASYRLDLNRLKAPAHHDLARPAYLHILCVDTAADGLRRLIRSFARPGCSVEGVADFERALVLLTAEPARFELVVIGRAETEGSSLRFLRGLQRLRYAGHILVAPEKQAIATGPRAPGALALHRQPARSGRGRRATSPRV